MQIPNPENMDLETWSDAVNSVIGLYTTVAHLTNDWRAWGCTFFLNPHLGALDPPNPYDYVDWRDWGHALANSLGNASGAPGKVL